MTTEAQVVDRPEMDDWLIERGVDDETRMELVRIVAGMGQMIVEMRAALQPFAECEPLDFHTQYDGQPTPQRYAVTTKKPLRAHDFQEAHRLAKGDRT